MSKLLKLSLCQVLLFQKVMAFVQPSLPLWQAATLPCRTYRFDSLPQSLLSSPWHSTGTVLRSTVKPDTDETRPCTLEAGKVKDIVEQWSRAARVAPAETRSRVLVSKATTLTKVMTDFWSAVSKCSQLKIDRYRNGDSYFTGQLLFVAPYFDLLNEPTQLSSLETLLDFCSGSSGKMGLGRGIQLTTYHPKGRAPPLATTETPFPVFCLDILCGDITPMPVNVLPKREQNELNLEMKFNGPAASSTADKVIDARDRGYTLKTQPNAETVMSLTKLWATGMSMELETPADDHVERDLQSVFQYTISGSTTTEMAYADVWTAIGELLQKAHESEATGAGLSSLLVLPLYHSFNAEAFKFFTSLLNIALEESALAESIALHAYHPELVEEGGVIRKRLRSPFPTVHLIHRGEKHVLHDGVPPVQVSM